MAQAIKTNDIFENSINETVSKAEYTARESALSQTDSAVLEILKTRDPATYLKLRGEAEKAVALPHVKPGDLITAELINALIDRINALEDAGDSVLRLGQLALQAHTLVALGGTLAAGAGLWLDGERLLDKENAVANLAVLDGASLAVRLAVATDAAGGEAAIAQLNKVARKGDVLMAQLSTTTKADANVAGTNAAEASTSLIHAYLSVIQADGQFEQSLQFLNSIQSGHLPFTWGLYNTALKRFVLGGASEDFRVQQVLAQVRHTG